MIKEHITKMIIALISVFIMGETEPEIALVQQEETAMAPVAGVIADLQFTFECQAAVKEEAEIQYDNLEELAICVEAEAGNQSMEGKRLVVDVILNRVDDEDWPDTVKEVIEQPVQFSSYWDGGMERVTTISEETYEAIRMEIEERSYPGIYYFTAEGYGRLGTPWRKVGDHYFCTK